MSEGDERYLKGKQCILYALGRAGSAASDLWASIGQEAMIIKDIFGT